MIRIMQYCDGVLPARDAARVAEEIARDPEAARLAEEMLTGAGAARAAWGNVVSEPVPFELARRVTQSARGPARAIRTGAADWRMAAALVVGAVLGIAGVLAMQHGTQQGLRLAGSETAQNPDTSWHPALMRALAKEPETARVVFGGASGGENAVSIARWFDTATGLRCADFVKSSADTVTGGGIACRKADGGWDVIEQPK